MQSFYFSYIAYFLDIISRISLTHRHLIVINAEYIYNHFSCEETHISFYFSCIIPQIQYRIGTSFRDKIEDLHFLE